MARSIVPKLAMSLQRLQINPAAQVCMYYLPPRDLVVVHRSRAGESGCLITAYNAVSDHHLRTHMIKNDGIDRLHTLDLRYHACMYPLKKRPGLDENFLLQSVFRADTV